MGGAPPKRLRSTSAAALAVGAALGLWPAAAAADDEPSIRMERWREDWRGSDLPLKDIDLGGDARLSLGGEVRVKVEALNAPRLGITGERSDGWITQRAMGHADLRVGERARVFVQVGAYDAVSRKLKNIADDDQWDVSQAFVDLKGGLGSMTATLRVGRQEMYLGSPRWVALREASNIRQRQDVARLMLAADEWKADLFTGRPTQERVGPWDDRGDPAQRFSGVRVERRFGRLALDVSYFDLIRRDFQIAGAIGKDRRTSVAVQLAGPIGGGFDVDAEVMFQSGDFADQRVAAYGGAIDLGRTFDSAWRPRLAGRLTYGTGDRDPNDRRQQTFQPPFPRTIWFGQNGLSSFANTVETAATLTLDPNPRLLVLLKAGASWRQDGHDFAYAGGSLALPGTRLRDRFVGTSTSAAFVWRATPRVMFAGYFSAAFIGHALKSVGAHDIVYANTAVTFSY